MKDNIHGGFQFGSWQAFPSRNLLEGPPGEVHIEPKVMQVLVCLASDAGRVVDHDTLLNKVWEGRAFSDEPLGRCIFELRRALGESSKDPKYIETIPKSGYRLVATVESLATPQASLPSGGRRRALAMLFVLVLVAGTFVAYRSTNPGLTESSPAVVGSTSRVNSSGYSIAVLPFVNMSSEPEQEYFSDGLSEEVLNLLAQVPDLKVVGRTSSFSFKGKNEDPREVGATLGVKTVLEGSVRKSGDQVRVTAQLIDASDGALIWSQTFERTMSEVFALQDDVAAAIIDALQIHVGANPTRGRPTDNTEAYTLFLKASVQKRDRGFGYKESLLRAIELDPQFAEAHELLAYHHWKHLEQQQAYDVAAEALAIDPDLVLAQAVYQQAKIGTRLAGVEAFERAVRKKPNNLDLLEPFLWNSSR